MSFTAFFVQTKTQSQPHIPHGCYMPSVSFDLDISLFLHGIFLLLSVGRPREPHPHPHLLNLRCHLASSSLLCISQKLHLRVV